MLFGEALTDSSYKTQVIRINPEFGSNITRHYGYWDGMISGLLKWQHQFYLFEMLNEPWAQTGLYEDGEISQERHRDYGVVSLEKQELKALLKKDYLFTKWVGTHTRYRKDTGFRTLGCKDYPIEEMRRNYYENPRPEELTKLIKPTEYKSLIYWFRK